MPESAEALGRLLSDLGVAGTQIPTSLDARAALYRTRLADQRIEGVVRACEFRDGRWCDGYLYSRLRNDPSPL